MQKTIVFSIILGVVFSSAAFTNADLTNGGVSIQRYSLRNLTRNSGIISQNIETATGDEIEFSIGAINTSETIARDTRIHVYLPLSMQVVSGSLRIGGVTSGANFVSNSILLGNLNALEQKDISFRAVPSTTMAGFYGIQAQVSAGNFGTDTKFAWINVLPRTAFLNGVPTTNYSPTPTPYTTPGNTPVPTTIVKAVVTTKVVYVYAEKEEMRISKMGRNLTAGQEKLTKQINAHPGDELEFSIQLVSASDKTIYGIIIKDTLPEQIDYIFNSARMGQQLISDKVFREGFLVGSLKPREAKTYYYRARVLPEYHFEPGEIEVKNISEAKATNADTVTDSASIFIKKGGLPLLGGLLSFAGFWIYMFILLAAMGILLLIFWLQDRKRRKALAQS